MKTAMSNECAVGIIMLLMSAALFAYLGMYGCDRDRRSDAYVLVKDGTASAKWDYQQLPMSECRWCQRRVNLNRHHIVPQAANPALRDVRSNLIVLCRDCHFVLGHRCDWKRSNPDVMEICERYTNTVVSAEARAGLESPPAKPVAQEPIVINPSVTNDVPPAQRDALKAILES